MNNDTNSTAPTKHVVIVGAGFAGLHAARALAKVPVRVTVIDRQNHHLFQPLLYQVATATLSTDQIAYPIRSVLSKQRNAQTLLAEAQGVDVEGKSLQVDGDEFEFDWLIVATGVTHSYFGHDEWAQFAPGLKSLNDALEIRRRVLSAFEMAERDPKRASMWLTFVVVGAGPTGVELAGALAEIARRSLTDDFRAIDPTSARVLLIEGDDVVLPVYPDKLSISAREQLESLGVEVHTGARVVGIDAEGIQLGDGQTILARTVLWAAGVQGSALAKQLGVELTRTGQVKVEPDLSVPGHSDVFVIGDLASSEGPKGRVPGVAPAAIQAGKHAARCIAADVKGQPRPVFEYRDRGSLATIGWARAVADLGFVRFSGTVAWFAWMVIHIMFLIGFRNRLFVLMGWAWSYVTFQRGARLITGKGFVPMAEAVEK